ncbi:transposase family protein [Streptomyces sp. NPDC004732]|uniref:transposase family protein n=1 Tax=Streptomyces sp. NPDC004732 TaxID=3154290 RepID=UPI0033B5A292
MQVIADPKGRLLWASPALAGAVHDVRAAREHGVIEALARAGINCWADRGHQGAGSSVRHPYRDRWDSPPPVSKPSTSPTRKSEHWSSKPSRCSTTRITRLVQAVLTLHLASST